LDRDSSRRGERIYGLSILSFNEAASLNVKAVVIAANVQYWNTIYLRVKECAEKNKITVFYTNGIPAKPPCRQEREEYAYWSVCEDDLKKLCAAYEVVSFDIFDTLLLRKAADSTDIFWIVEKELEKNIRYNKSLPQRFNFRAKRIEAERLCREKFGKALYTIENIYDILAELAALDTQTKTALKQLEFETETRFLEARHSLALFLRELHAAGKRIILVSDTCYNAARLGALLKHHGIEHYDKIYASCEIGMSKESGALWKYVVKELNGKHAVHIGDSAEADVINASHAGVFPFYILKSTAMLRNSILERAARYDDDAGGGIAAGLLQNALYNDPFALYKTQGRPHIATPKLFGYCFFGPIALLVIEWLAAALLEDKPELLLFCARDGWLFEKLYTDTRAKHTELPKALYLKASRRLCGSASFRTQNDILEAMRLSYTGSSDYFFKERFGVKPPVANRHISTADAETKELVIEHSALILEHAEKERSAYLKYLEELIGGAKNIAIFDSGQNGSIQFFLQKIITRDIAGYYIFYAQNSGVFADKNLKTNALCGENSPAFPVLSGNKHILEAVFTEPLGTYLYAETPNSFVTDKESENKNIWPVIKEIHDGILEYTHDYRAASGGSLSFSTEYAATLIDLVKEVTIPDAIKNALCFEDRFRSDNNRRMPIL
jgi:HAD superfamily hydrolase (TIGR01549 family)